MIRLFAEFSLLFLLTPVLIAVFLPPAMMFPALFAMTALGVGLLFLTPGFSWRSLLEGAGRMSWGLVLVTAVTTFAVSWVILGLTAPERLFALIGTDPPRNSAGWPIIWIVVVFYPLVSALPQELIFRPLFFRRYGRFLPKGIFGLVLNAAVFSFAHLMYWSWIVAALTFMGGLLFAWSFEKRGNFPEAVVLHSVAGVVLFAVGMGAYFYSGNVVRPF